MMIKRVGIDAGITTASLAAFGYLKPQVDRYVMEGVGNLFKNPSLSELMNAYLPSVGLGLVEGGLVLTAIICSYDALRNILQK